ncbi:MAG: transposase [Clostridiales bacterium]|jgi:IS605 OrfB family transposase|nr:transposase [Clostridiales bacterium]
METVVKTVRQHSLAVNNIKELKEITTAYTRVKNYVYSRYSGINSLLLLKNHRVTIRDEWIKSEFAKRWKLPARYWKTALDEAISNIKTEWTNTKRRVKLAVINNVNLSEDERKFVLYILKADSILYAILHNEEFSLPNKLQRLVIRKQYLYSLIKRYIRKYKGEIPYSYKTESFMIDNDMYDYKLIDNKLKMYIQGLKFGQRVEIELKDKNTHKGNLRILIKGNFIEIHKAKYIKVKEKLNVQAKTIGLDKGYRCLLATSENKFYGERLNDFLSKETERLNRINAERNKFWALMKKYEKEGNIKRAENIKKFNLGRIKYNRNKSKFDTQVKSYINREINRFITEDKPTEVVLEDLGFVSWNNKFPSNIKRKLSRWIKGYIKERLSYKCNLNNIEQCIVNAAYTSRVCHKCGSFGVRDNEVFTCTHCGRMDADYNASKNIEMRKYDRSICLYTPYRKVKEILEKRCSA